MCALGNGFCKYTCWSVSIFSLCSVVGPRVCCVYCVAVKGVFIVAAKRTPFGGYGGKLLNFTTVDLQEQAFRAALAAGNVKPEWIDSVVAGNVYPVSAAWLVHNDR